MKDKIQKWWGESTKNKAILIGVILLIVIGAFGATKGTSTNNTTEEVPTSNNEATTEVVFSENKESSQNDNYKLLEKFSPKDIYDDDSCHWYLATIYEDIQMQDIAREYAEVLIEDSADIHYIVNPFLKTTSVIYDMPTLGIVNVKVYEYVDGEENNTDTFATGKKLAEYNVNKKTGEIEKKS